MRGLVQDLRFAARMLRKTPGFTAAAVLSLALGIGANTAIFQLLDAVRLKMLPVRAPQELAQIGLASPEKRRGSYSDRYNSLTNPLWEQIRDRQQAFSGVFAWSLSNFNLAQSGEVRMAKSLWVSGDFFNVLGVQPALGRVLNPSDDVRGCTAPGVVISHGFWQKEFGGAPDVVGRKLTLADHSLAVVGVTSPEFYGLEVGKSFDFAVPICAEALLRGKNSRLDSGTNWWLMVTGRLKPGESLPQANASLQSMSAGLFEASLPRNYPEASVKDYLGSRLEASSAAAGFSLLRQDYERPLWLLFAIAGLVLVIACANQARQREHGISRPAVNPRLSGESLNNRLSSKIFGAKLLNLP